jgi:hypothetical protein
VTRDSDDDLLPPWARVTYPRPETTRRGAAVVIPCAGTESARVVLAALRAYATGTALAAILAGARIEERDQ